MADYQTMLIALRESMTVPTKREAGVILAEGGWAVFPIPNYQKFDQGLSYLHATTSGAAFDDMAENVMLRHECFDVNIALCPGKCVVPLIVVDLDGSQAIHNFFNAAQDAGHVDVGMWLRVNTTRVDHGRHIYFVAPGGKAWSNSNHVWGGEVRSGRGHVVMPPSTTETGRYTWVGETLYTAPAWVIEGLHGGVVGNQSRDGEKSDAEIEELLNEMSAWPTDAYGRKALDNMVEEMLQAKAGDQMDGRNPLLSKTINRVMDLASEGRCNGNEAVSEIAETYESLFSPDETNRSPIAEVIRCVRSWFRSHETVKANVQDTQVLQQWAQQRGGDASAPLDLPDSPNVMTDAPAAATSATGRVLRPRARGGKDWKSAVNK